MEAQVRNLVEYLWVKTCEQEGLDAALVRDKSIFLAGAQSVLLVLLTAAECEENPPCDPYQALCGMLDDIESSYNEFEIPQGAPS